MKRTITVSSSFSGKISTGQWENASPFFAASETIELDCSDQEALAYTQARQDALQALCAGSFEQEVIKAKINKIKADRKDFRIVDGRPSVTTILGYDKTFFVDPEELKQYAAIGTIVHKQVEEFIKTGVWKKPHEIEGLGAELFLVKKGSLGLELEGWDFEEYVKKNKLENMINGEFVVNKKDSYCGTPDFTCTANGIKTICDIKRTVEKVSNFCQMAAYEMALREMGHTPNEQMMIVPLNAKTQQGYSKAVISTDIDRYYELFMFKRKEFRRVYDI